MKIHVDSSLCQGHAMCWAVNEDLYPIDDDGFSLADGNTVAAGLESDAEAGVAICPERAIRLDG